MIVPTIKLLAYANPVTGSLEQTTQAEELIAAIQACQLNFIDLDFSGVEGISTEFSDQFLRLAGNGLGETWLIPRNYGPSCNRLAKCLLSRLTRQREEAWVKGCELFVTGIKPLQTSSIPSTRWNPLGKGWPRLPRPAS